MILPSSFKIKELAAKEARSIAGLVWASLVFSVGVMLFTVPFRFPDAGVTGLAALLNYTAGISIPIVTMTINFALLAWACRSLSLAFVIKTLACTALASFFMWLMEGLPYPETDQVLLIAIIGGAIKGYACGMMIRSGGSSGGTDIIVMFLHKKFGIEVGKYSIYINAAILFASIFVVGIERAMLGVISLFVDGVAVDRTISSFDRRRQVFLVTSDPEPIVAFITHSLKRGSTICDVCGGYSGAPLKMVICLITRSEEVALRTFTAKAQPRAFMFISEASEVLGEGFKPWR